MTWWNHSQVGIAVFSCFAIMLILPTSSLPFWWGVVAFGFHVTDSLFIAFNCWSRILCIRHLWCWPVQFWCGPLVLSWRSDQDLIVLAILLPLKSNFDCSLCVQLKLFIFAFFSPTRRYSCSRVCDWHPESMDSNFWNESHAGKVAWGRRS